MGAQLKDGTYDIDVTSSSTMFRITHCELSANDGEMTAVMTLGGTGYEKLYMGTGVEAAAANDSDYIYYVENGAGEYTYTVPVKALDTETDCAAFSIRKQQWYDRTLVFESSSLPKEAFSVNYTPYVICAAGVAIAAAIAAVLIRKTIKVKKGSRQ